MNLIVQNTNKLIYHTNVGELLEPIKDEIKGFPWVISDLEVSASHMTDLPISYDKEWFLISAQEMEILRKSDTKIIWRVFSAIHQDRVISINEKTLPTAEGVPEIWKDGNFEIEESVIEIIAWDSSYTIVKFVDPRL